MKDLRSKTDHELIQDFQQGNLNALEVLVLRHKDKLFTSIMFLVKDKYLAEDIFQDVLIKIIDTIRAGRYTSESRQGSPDARVAAGRSAGSDRTPPLCRLKL